MRSVNRKFATKLCPALLTKERLERACAKRRIPKPSTESKGRYDPIEVVFWRDGDHDLRVLKIMPDGALVQSATPHVTYSGLELDDEHPNACYTRWFFQEITRAGRARRRGWFDVAHDSLRLARRYRWHAEMTAAPEPIPHLQAAE